MKVYNFLFATNNQLRQESLLIGLKNTLMTDITNCGDFEIGRFDFVFSRNDLSEKIKSGVYDVVICSEELGTEKIGAGSLKLWSNENPDVKVILLVANAKKGNVKLIKLIQEVKYTSALFICDLNGANICQLVEKGRSLQEAIFYYGVNESPEIKQMGVLSEEVSDEKLKHTKEEAGKERISEESLESAIEAFKNFDEFVKETEEFAGQDKENAEPKGEGAAQAASEDMNFSFDNFFSVTQEVQETVIEEFVEETEEGFGSFMENTAEVKQGKEVECRMENEIRRNVVTPMTEEMAKVYKREAASMDKEAEEMLGNAAVVESPMVVSRSVKDTVVASKGRITKVIDYNSLLLEFVDSVALTGIDVYEDYRYLIRIKSGEKGRVENGRYRSGNVAFEAYVEYMVSNCTAMMAVPDFNCEVNCSVVDNKDCDIIMTRL